MAEIGALASIIAIAGVGVKLSKTLYQIGHKTVSADHSINQIATQVTLFSATLKHVGVVLSDSASLHSVEAIETVERIVKECEVVFKEITQLVLSASNAPERDAPQQPVGANGRRRRLSVLQKAKWYFEGPKVERLQAQLECLKTTLSLFLQTLSLATVTASAQQARFDKEAITQRVEQERIHVETLIMAQQLSFVVVQDLQHDTEAVNRSPSPAYSEVTVEIPARPPLKLLTQEPSDVTTMVQLESGDLGFLKNKAPSSGSIMSPIFESTPNYVDQLLNRWTRLGDISTAVSSRDPSPHSARNQSQVGNEVVLLSKDRNVDGPANRDPTLGTPELQLHTVPSPEDNKIQLSDRFLHDQNKFLDANTSRPLSTSPSALPHRRASSQSRMETEEHPSYALSTASYARGMTSAEHMAKSGVFGQSREQEIASLQPTAPLAIVPRAMTPVSPMVSPNTSNLGWYTSRGRLALPAPPIRPSNYQSPYVEHYSSTSGSETDSEDSEKSSAKRSSDRRRRGSNGSGTFHQHRSAESGNGLGIPWRIRLSPTKYFDFQDGRLVGPRTPYRPTESLAWIYGQPNARTEISKNWVVEEAIQTQKYKYHELLASDAQNPAFGEEEKKWAIDQPLKFYEIEALVELTITLFRKKKHSETYQQNPQLSGQQRPHVLRNGTSPQTAIPHSPIAPKQGAHGQKRSVSFNGPLPGPRDRSPLPMPGGPQHDERHSTRDRAPPDSNSRNGPWGPQSEGYPASKGLQSPRSPQAAGSTWSSLDSRDPDKFADRRERDRLGYFDYDDDRDRPSSRGKSSHRESHRDSRDRRTRDKDKERDKKKKHASGSTMAATMGKIAGLAAILEGLDGLAGI